MSVREMNGTFEVPADLKSVGFEPVVQDGRFASGPRSATLTPTADGVITIELIDGVTDYAAIINAALREPGVTEVRLGAGVFTVSAPISLPSGAHLTGAGREATTIKANEDFFGRMGNAGIVESEPRATDITLSDFLIDANKILPMGIRSHGLFLNMVEGFDVTRVDVANATGYAHFAAGDVNALNAGDPDAKGTSGSYTDIRTFNSQVHFEVMFGDGVTYTNVHARDGDGDISTEAYFHPLLGSRNITYDGVSGFGNALLGFSLISSVRPLENISIFNSRVEITLPKSGYGFIDHSALPTLNLRIENSTFISHDYIGFSGFRIEGSAINSTFQGGVFGIAVDNDDDAIPYIFTVTDSHAIAVTDPNNKFGIAGLDGTAGLVWIGGEIEARGSGGLMFPATGGAEVSPETILVNDGYTTRVGFNGLDADTLLFPAVPLPSAGLGSLVGGSVVVGFRAYSDPADAFEIVVGAVDGISVVGDEVRFHGLAFGTVSGGSGGVDMVIALNGAATQTAVEALVQSIAYASGGQDPGTRARLIEIDILDANGQIADLNTVVHMGQIVGGFSNAVYVIGSEHTQIVEEAGSGIDEVRTSLGQYVLPTNIEKLTYFGSGSASLQGNGLNNQIAAAAGDDLIDLRDGGNDIALGWAGSDRFFFGGAYTALDQVQGGEGDDEVFLQGDYSAGLTLGVLGGVEAISFLSGFDDSFAGASAAANLYRVIATDGAVAPGAMLVVRADGLSADEGLDFDGAAEADGRFVFYGGSGNDVLTGGALGDHFDLSQGGADLAFGGGGDDVFVLFDARGSWLTGGSGADRYRFNAASGDLLITDFATGPEGDLLDLDAVFASMIGFDGSDPLAGGYLRIVQSGGDALVQWDRDGAADGVSWVTIATLAGVAVGALRAENVSAFYPAGGFAAPAAESGAFTTNEEQVLSGQVAATDPDSAMLTFRLVTGPAHGTLTFAADGSYEYLPDPDYNGADSFTFAAFDGTQVSDTGTVSITIAPINDAPSGTDQTITLGEDSLYAFTIADFGFSDLEGDGFDAVIITALPSHGMLLLNGEPVTAGLAISSADIASLIYHPQLHGNGEGYAAFTFQVRDDGPTGGAHRNLDPTLRTISVDVTAVDDAPAAVADAGATAEDTTVNVAVLANDIDVDGGPRLVAAINGIAVAAGQSVTLASQAIVTLNADGTITYDPNGAFDYLVSAATGAATGAQSQATDSFVYSLNGGSAATVQMAVNGVTGAGDQLRGTSGNDNITGTGAADLINLSDSGDDAASGAAGNDGFYFGAFYSSADSVDGGAGNLDQVGLQGDYSAGVTLGALPGIELLVLLRGNDNRFGGATGTSLSYTLTATDATVAAGQLLTVQANMLRAGENFTFDGSAETNGTFLIYGGLGTDTLTGGAGADGFFFGEGRFGADDVVNGGGGSDQIGFQGNFAGGNSLVFGANQLNDIEFIVLLSASDSRFGASGGVASYTLHMHDGNVGAGERLIVSANTLKTGESLLLFGADESDGSYVVYAGAGNDSLAGGARADELWGGAGDDIIYGLGGADLLRGGTGNDQFRYALATDSTPDARDRILDFATGDTLHLVELAANNGLAGFTFLGAGAPSGAGQVQVVQTGNQATVNIFIDGDAVADMAIDVTVIDGHALTAADFMGILPAQRMLDSKLSASGGTEDWLWSAPDAYAPDADMMLIRDLGLG